jgi:hypothetical protein
MYQYQLRRPDQMKPGDQFRYHGALRTVTAIHRSLGSGWTVALKDFATANVTVAEYVVVRTDADPLRDPMFLS